MARASGMAINRLAARESRLAGRTPLQVNDWRVIRHVLSSGRTLRDAIGRCVECFEAIDWRCGRMALQQRGDLAIVRQDARRPEAIAGPTSCLIDIYGIAHMHTLFSALIARRIPLTGLWLGHGEDSFRALDLPPLPYRVHLTEGWTGFAFPAAYLDHPVLRGLDEPGAQSATGNFLFPTLRGDAEEEAGEELSLKVRGIALRALRDGDRLPSFDEVAARFSGSAATLRRRLARAGTSYRQIRDSCRREVALNLLRYSDASIETISERLDFCDSDAFRRAFRGWFGVAPSAYRQSTDLG
jgi:AraC-like DNA-binding protein